MPAKELLSSKFTFNLTDEPLWSSYYNLLNMIVDSFIEWMKGQHFSFTKMWKSYIKPSAFRGWTTNQWEVEWMAKLWSKKRCASKRMFINAVICAHIFLWATADLHNCPFLYWNTETNSPLDEVLIYWGSPVKADDVFMNFLCDVRQLPKNLNALFSVFVGSPSSLATLLLPCTPCCT